MKRFDPEDIVISSDSITGTVWSDNLPTLDNFYTSSAQTSSNTGDYYFNIYQTSSDLSTADIQFDISYGHVDGSGSVYYNVLVPGASPTRTTYGQQRTLVLGDENSSFIYGTHSGSDFFAISVERARFKEKLFPGSMTLVLSGSGVESLSLTDNSTTVVTNTYNDAGRVYQIVSGSAGTVYTGDNDNGYAGTGANATGSYGLFLPDIGMILLNPDALSGSAAAGGIELLVSRSANSPGGNLENFFTALEGGSSFLLNSEETISSMYAFVRARNNEFNYSTNPSFISGSTGAVIHNSYIETPQVYVCGVGFYNDANELLATAKLSRPMLKDFTTELLIRAKLDF